jgi:hypothetical protein
LRAILGLHLAHLATPFGDRKHQLDRSVLSPLGRHVIDDGARRMGKNIGFWASVATDPFERVT